MQWRHPMHPETAPLLAAVQLDHEQASTLPALEPSTWTHHNEATADSPETKANGQQSLESVLFRQLPALLCVARPYHALTLSGLSVLEAYIVSRSGTVAGSFYRVLVDHEAAALWRTVVLAAALYSATSVVQAVTRWLYELVAASSRAAVTSWLHALYCCGAAFARLPPDIDNPDQRMANDVERWAEELGRLAAVFAAAPLKVLFYTHWMAQLTSLPAVALVYVFFLLSSLLQRFLLGPIAKAVFRQEQLEGDLRAAHARLRAAAVEAALAGGSTAEQAVLQRRLASAVANQRRLAAWHALQAGLIKAVDYGGAVIAYCCVALAIFHGSSALSGSGGQAAERVSNASFAALMLMNSFSQMMDSSDRLSSLAGLTARVYQLAEALQLLQQPVCKDAAYSDAQLLPKPSRPVDPAMSATLDGPRLISTPQGPLEVSLHSLGRNTRAEVAAVLPDAPHGCGLLAVLTFQFATEGVRRVSDADAVSDPPTAAQAAWQQEMDRMLACFLHVTEAVRVQLSAQHCWCDAIDPCTGRPLYGSPGSCVWSEVAAASTFLGYSRSDAGICPVVLHPQHGTASYPATLFTDAPLRTMQATLAAVAAGSRLSPQPAPALPLLCLRDVTYSTADGVLCAARLSFQVAVGGAVLVEGRSGSGKSTLVRALASLHPLQSGSFELPPPSQVMFLPQRALTAPGGTLYHQMSYGCSRPVSTLDMAAALQRAGLRHLLDRAGGDWQQPLDWAGQLSVGENQRLMIARLLLERPALAVLDESTSAIGSEASESLLSAVRAAGVAILSFGQLGDAALRRQHDMAVTLLADGTGGWFPHNS